ncbi:hypothetical protein ACNKHQ_02070 [Shigella flexneri]
MWSDGERRQAFIVVFKNVTNVPVKILIKAQTHSLAFDGDFREQFNDKLHGGNGSLADLTGLSAKRSIAA